MAMKNKFHIKPNMIRVRMKDLKYTYKKIEEETNSEITETDLKYFMNKSNMVDQEKINVLANVLMIDGNELIEEGDLLSLNIPFEINSLTKNLYDRMREDIQPVYAKQINNYKETCDLDKILELTHILLMLFTKDDCFLNKESIPSILVDILQRDEGFNCLCNQYLTGITADCADNLRKQFEYLSDEEDYDPQKLFFIFTYVFILFDAIFLAECLATSFQLMPQRKNAKADQYYDLTNRSNDMCKSLINETIYKNKNIFQIWRSCSKFNGMKIEEAGLDDVVLEGVILMLSACEMCFKHQQSLYHKSEYVNRSSLNAILTKLENIFSTIGLEIVPSHWDGFSNSRFWVPYKNFQFLTKEYSRKQKKNGFDEAFIDCFNKCAIKCICDNIFGGNQGNSKN